MVRIAEMSCEAFEPFIDAYIDEEFGDRERADMEAHLATCEDCRKMVEEQIAFRAELRRHLEVTPAPETLRKKVMSGLEDLEREQVQREQKAKIVRISWVVGPLAAMLAMAIVVPNLDLTVAPAASSSGPVIDHTVDWHQSNFPLEVTTADAEEARIWFEDKVDFSVRLPQFADDRVNLLGGRMAHIEDRRAALLLYEVDGARLSVILFDGDGVKVPREKLRRIHDRDIVWLNQRGYGVAVVQDSGVTYAMTSDLSEKRFLHLVADTLER